jgi:hypothetical protein
MGEGIKDTVWNLITMQTYDKLPGDNQEEK